VRLLTTVHFEHEAKDIVRTREKCSLNKSRENVEESGSVKQKRNFMQLSEVSL